MEFKLQGLCCLVGDIHGQYEVELPWACSQDLLLEPKLADNYIFLGDIGFGFDKLRGFIKELDRTIPEEVNCYFIRGNHDDPSYWRGDKAKRVTNLCPRFHMVKDYDVMVIGKKRYLCIGGGISIDRHYRIEGKSYWDDEHILPCPKEITLGKIDGIFSHTGFTPPVLTHKHALQQRFPDVNQDCQDEQQILYKILELYKPKEWYFGHYHVHCDFIVKDCECTILDIGEHHLLK